MFEGLHRKSTKCLLISSEILPLIYEKDSDLEKETRKCNKIMLIYTCIVLVYPYILLASK